MATIADLPELTTKPDPGDFLVVRDISDATNKDKKMAFSRLYEAGSFSPTIYGSSTPGSPTFSVSQTRYVRIGELCFVRFYIAMSSKGSMAGNVVIGGLPFVVSGTHSRPIWWPYQLATGVVQLAIDLTGGQTYGGLVRSTGAAVSGNTTMPVSDLNNNTHLQFSFGYVCQQP